MSYFAPDLVTYTDATLGWNFDSFQALRNVFEQYMPGWKPPARSYATAILPGEVSALVHMVDTPELFGGELRILAAVDFRDGKIIRWIDYWDAGPYDEQLYAQFRAPSAHFPRDLKDTQVPTQAAPELVTAATSLQEAFAVGDVPAGGGPVAHRCRPHRHVAASPDHRPDRDRPVPRPCPRGRALRPVKLATPHRRRHRRRRVRVDRRTPAPRSSRHHRPRTRRRQAHHEDHLCLRLTPARTGAPGNARGCIRRDVKRATYLTADSSRPGKRDKPFFRASGTGTHQPGRHQRAASRKPRNISC